MFFNRNVGLPPGERVDRVPPYLPWEAARASGPCTVCRTAAFRHFTLDTRPSESSTPHRAVQITLNSCAVVPFDFFVEINVPESL